MSKREELIEKYAVDLKEKCSETADMKLLTAVTIGCGPAIYNADASTVSGSDEKELATVKNIVSAHSGKIAVESNGKEGGAVFELKFPVSKA